MKQLLSILLLLLATVTASAQLTGPQINFRGIRASAPATCTADKAWIYYDTTENTFKWCASANTWSSLGGSNLFDGPAITSNRFLYSYDADTIASSDYQLESGTGDFVTPATKKIRAWGSTDVSAYATPLFNYNTSYSTPNSKVLYGGVFARLDVSSIGSGGSLGGMFYGLMNINTTTSNSPNGVFMTSSCGGGATCSGTLTGGYFGSGAASATATTLTHIQGYANINTATVTNANGVLSQFALFNATTVTNVNLFNASLTGAGSNTGTTSNVYGYKLSGWSKAAGATYTNTYGIYADTSIDLGTNKYFIYSLSTSPSLFSGDVTVGGTGKFYVSTSQTPASATEACTAGQIAWDSGFIYVCVATDTWKKAAIATW